MTDIDVAYLREKNVAQLLESLAADIVTQKPSDPEAFLRSRFSTGEVGAIARGEECRLHCFTLDPSCALALIATSYARINLDYTEVDFDTQAQLTPQFSRVNAFQRVPVLEHQGVVLLEPGSICRYLCHTTAAYPSSTRDRAKTDAAFEAIRCYLLPDVTAAVYEKVLNPRRLRRPCDPLGVAQAVDKVKATLAAIGRQFFRESAWVVGREFSIADMALAACAFSMTQVVGELLVFNEGTLQTWWAAAQNERCVMDGLRGFANAAAAQKAAR